MACKILISASGLADSGGAPAAAGASPQAPPPELELPEGALQQLFEEAAVMDRLRHPNLVTFMGLCRMPPCILTGERRGGGCRAECAAGGAGGRVLGAPLST